MEKVSSIASATSKMIWGEKKDDGYASGTEPVSGKKGKGTVDEPYDQGNREDGPTSPTSPTSPTESTFDNEKSIDEKTSDSANPASTALPISSTANDSSGANESSKPTTTDITPPKSGNTEPVTTSRPEDDKDGAKGKDNEKDKDTSMVGDASGVPDSDAPSQPVAADPPKLDPEADTKKAETTQAEAKQPDDDVSANKPEKNDDQGDKGEDGNQEVLGTKYVKSTGLAADGGDFDAAKPGAAKEADRLMAEKGVKRDAPSTPESKPTITTGKESAKTGSPAPTTNSAASTPSKRSLSRRFKDKLHIGKK
jgi:hypothetical protein